MTGASGKLHSVDRCAVSGRIRYGIKMRCAYVVSRIYKSINHSLAGTSGGADDEDGWFVRRHDRLSR